MRSFFFSLGVVAAISFVALGGPACGSGDDDDDAAPADHVSDDDSVPAADDTAISDDSGDDAADDDLDDDVDDDTADDTADDTGDDTADDTSDDDTDPVLTHVSGRVYRFDWSWDYLEDASVEVFERPDLVPAITDADGFFSFDGLFAGEDNTFVTRRPDFWPTQTATIVPGADGVDDVTVQIPPRIIVRALSLVLWEPLETDRCQIATTVTESGSNPFSPGLAGAVVSIDPPLPADHGPFYFEIVEIPGWPFLDLPRRDLTETTGDGGAIFVNVPEGEYVLSASRGEESFTTARVKCRAGFLVNAAPPYGPSLIDERS